MPIFIILLVLLFTSCALPQVNRSQNDFYLGLMNESAPEKVRLFERALTSPNEYIRRAAADELAVLKLHGTSLSFRTRELVRREASDWWKESYQLIEDAPNKENALSFLLNFEQDAWLSFDEARNFALKEFARQENFFTNIEIAVIEGHYAISRLRYNDALEFFRVFQTDGSWPEQMPDIFIEYPNLINDLGRAFQFTQSGNEGINLFLQWEDKLQKENIGSADDLRYRLLFYAARIARRRGQNPQAVTLFERSLPLAPDYEQQDACIWYILDLSMGGPVNVIMDRLERLVPLWYSGSYYNSLMERYLHRLVAARDWRRIIRTFNLIKDIDGIGVKAGFAWAIARSLEEGYLTAEDRRLAAQAINARTAEISAFMQIAYNASSNLLMPAMYYRMQSANALDLPFSLYSEETSSEENAEINQPPSPALQFLLDFFKYGAVDYFNPYVRRLERQLSPNELRAVAHALDEEGMHPQAMRIVALYVNRDDYTRNRRDLELMYPRPYLDLVEAHATEFNIDPCLLYGLIRTESAFQSAVVSHAGAVGLMQLMPGTAREQATRIRRAGGPDFFNADNQVDSTDIHVNLYIGSFYLNDRREVLGDMVLALMAYNAGHTRVRRWRAASTLPVDLLVETVPIYETRDYGRRVPVIGRIYRELYYR